MILSNAHVVREAKEVTVTLSARREFKVKVLGADPVTDVAVLRLDAKHLPMLRLGDPKKLNLGDPVTTIGAPFGYEESATQGIVSAKGRSPPGDSVVRTFAVDLTGSFVCAREAVRKPPAPLRLCARGGQVDEPARPSQGRIPEGAARRHASETSWVNLPAQKRACRAAPKRSSRSTARGGQPSDHAPRRQRRGGGAGHRLAVVRRSQLLHRRGARRGRRALNDAPAALLTRSMRAPLRIGACVGVAAQGGAAGIDAPMRCFALLFSGCALFPLASTDRALRAAARLRNPPRPPGSWP